MTGQFGVNILTSTLKHDNRITILLLLLALAKVGLLSIFYYAIFRIVQSSMPEAVSTCFLETISHFFNSDLSCQQTSLKYFFPVRLLHFFIFYFYDYVSIPFDLSSYHKKL